MPLFFPSKTLRSFEPANADASQTCASAICLSSFLRRTGNLKQKVGLRVKIVQNSSSNYVIFSLFLFSFPPFLRSSFIKMLRLYFFFFFICFAEMQIVGNFYGDVIVNFFFSIRFVCKVYFVLLLHNNLNLAVFGGTRKEKYKTTFVLKKKVKHFEVIVVIKFYSFKSTRERSLCFMAVAFRLFDIVCFDCWFISK